MIIRLAAQIRNCPRVVAWLVAAATGGLGCGAGTSDGVPVAPLGDVAEAGNAAADADDAASGDAADALALDVESVADAVQNVAQDGVQDAAVDQDAAADGAADGAKDTKLSDADAAPNIPDAGPADAYDAGMVDTSDAAKLDGPDAAPADVKDTVTDAAVAADVAKDAVTDVAVTADAAKDTAPPLQCTGGECCSAIGTYLAKGSKCGSKPVAVKAKCGTDASSWEGAEGWGTCTGASPNCNTAPGAIVWSAYTKSACANGKVCAPVSNPSQFPYQWTTCGGGIPCDSGPCCANGFVVGPPAAPVACGTTVTLTACVGHDIQCKYAQNTCDGTSGQCPADSTKMFSTTPCATVTCDIATNQHCTKVSDVSSFTETPANCTALAPGSCLSGGCCDLATKKVRPSGALCGLAKCAANTAIYSKAGTCDGVGPGCNPTTSASVACPAGSFCTSPGGCGPICSGGCCDVAANELLPKGTLCTAPDTLKYCDKVANVIVVQGQQATCAGGPACTYSSTYSNIPCPAGSTCTAVTGGAACIAPCTSGVCCNIATGKALAKGSPCGVAINPQNFGNGLCKDNQPFNVLNYYGCDGISTASCSSDLANASAPVAVAAGSTCPNGTSCVVDKDGAVGCVGNCSAGACCDTATGKPKPKGSKCGTVLSEQFACTSNQPMHGTTWAGCDGTSPACSTSLADATVEPLTPSGPACPSGSPCVASATSAACATPPGTCTAGECCDLVTKKFKTNEMFCGQPFEQYACTGNDVQWRKATMLCSGASATCPTDKTDPFSVFGLDPWQLGAACGTGTCSVINGIYGCSGSTLGGSACGANCLVGATCQSKSCVQGKCVPAQCGDCFASGQECNYSACNFSGCTTPPVSVCQGNQGTLTRVNLTVAGHAIAKMEVMYAFETILGEPKIQLLYRFWSSAGNVELPYTTEIYVRVVPNGGGGPYYVRDSPVVPKDGGSWSYNTPGSPNWANLFCGGPGKEAQCAAADVAKAIQKGGYCVSGFLVAW